MGTRESFLMSFSFPSWLSRQTSILRALSLPFAFPRQGVAGEERSQPPLKGAPGQTQTPGREFIWAITAAHYFRLIPRSEFRKQAHRRGGFAVASVGFLVSDMDGWRLVEGGGRWFVEDREILRESMENDR